MGRDVNLRVSCALPGVAVALIATLAITDTLGASIPWWAYLVAALAPGLFAGLTVLGMVVVVGILAALGDTTRR